MPTKRKNTDTTQREAKISKNEVKNKVFRVVIEDPEEEKEEEMLKVPISARAARQAAIAAGLYEEEEEEEEEENESLEDGGEYEEEQDEIDLLVAGEVLEIEEDVAIVEKEKQLIEKDLPRKKLEKVTFKEPKNPFTLDYNSVSNFTSTEKNTCALEQDGETYLFIGLERGEDIVFMGQVMVAPLYGAVTISGATLNSNRVVPEKASECDLSVHFYPVFCPRSHALLRIASAPLDTPSVTPHSSPIEIDENLLEAIYEELVVDGFETILVIKNLSASGIDDVNYVTGCYKNITTFRNKEAPRDSSQAIHLLSGFHPVLKPIPGVKAFRAPADWEASILMAMHAANERQSPSVSVVCGGKNLGKSSFSKYLVNRLLSQYKTVAYLEIDLGQTEFTPAGLLSLHYLQTPVLGPSYTHQQLEPVRSFFLGALSPRSNPEYYMACIRELVKHWRYDQKNAMEETQPSDWIPLVVNTHGWISGVGYEFLLEQIHEIVPTDIFAMRQHTVRSKNLPLSFPTDVLRATDKVMVAQVPPTLHFVDSYMRESNATLLSDPYNANAIRDLAFASYFHQTEMGPEAYLSPQWDYQKHQVERIPWVVDWRSQLNAVWVIFEEVKPEELFYALNGSVVGILGDVADYEKQKGPDRPVQNEEFTPPTYYNTQDRLPPQPEVTTCHGLAIVRAIDPSRHSLLLLTPLPAETLEKASGIVKGELQLPLWALMDNKLDKSGGVADVAWKNMPYVESDKAEGVGSKILKVRRNLLHKTRRNKE